MANWTAADIPSQAGKRAVVTGPGGLGYETALALTRAGASVILAGRNAKTGEAAAASIRAATRGDIQFGLVDLANLASVKAFADRLVAQGAALDLLVNNAGVMMPPSRKLTADGFELQLGTNYLGHYALTGRLLPLLSKAKAARVVSISSIAAKPPASIHFDDLQFAQAYRPDPAYGQSKLAMILFAFELQRRSIAAGWGVTSIGAHPGVSRTDLIDKGPGASSLMGIATRLLPFLRQPVAQGALPQLFAATSPDAKGGAYYGPDGFLEFRGYPHLAPVPALANDVAVARRLWDVSAQLTGVTFGARSKAPA